MRSCFFAIAAFVLSGLFPAAASNRCSAVNFRSVLFKSGCAIDGQRISIFRIPAICRAPNGDLIAAADARYRSSADLHHFQLIRIAYRRSTDEGKTWTPVALMHNLRWDETEKQSASDPSFIVDRTTGEIFCFWNSIEWVKKENKGSFYRWFVQSSRDNGISWSAPRELSRDLHRAEWTKTSHVFITSGQGTQLADGTLLHTMVWVEERKGALFGSADHGRTWRPVGSFYAPADENKVLELANGELMVNSRPPVASLGGRVLHRSADRGATWTGMVEKALPDPSCNGSVIHFDSLSGRKALLFSNCRSDRSRCNISLRVSYDDSRTWNQGVVINPGHCAYSDLVQLKDGDVGIIYEAFANYEIVFESVKRQAIESK